MARLTFVYDQFTFDREGIFAESLYMHLRSLAPSEYAAYKKSLRRRGWRDSLRACGRFWTVLKWSSFIFLAFVCLSFVAEFFAVLAMVTFFAVISSGLSVAYTQDSYFKAIRRKLKLLDIAYRIAGESPTYECYRAVAGIRTENA